MQADSKGWQTESDRFAACIRAVAAAETAYHPLNVTLMRARERAIKLAGEEYVRVCVLCICTYMHVHMW